MNCIDCGLPVMRNGDRHRTTDDIQCHRLLRWQTMSASAIKGQAEVDDIGEWLNALVLHAFINASGEDASFDHWAKLVILNEPSTTDQVTSLFALVQHADQLVDKIYCKSLYGLRATLRRLTVEAELQARLGSEQAVRDRLSDAYLVAQELDDVVSKMVL